MIPQRVILVGAVALGLAGCGGEAEADDRRGGPIAVRLAPVEEQAYTRRIEGVADVLADEGVVLTAERAGRVTDLLFREGQRVAQGAILVRFADGPERADIAVQQAGAAELRGQLARRLPLAAEGALPRGEVEDLGRQLRAAEARTRAARAVLRERVVRAPFSGTIGLRTVSPGAVVSPGDRIATLDKLDHVRLRFTVPEREFGRLRVGAPVVATSPAFPGRRFEGSIASFDSRLDQSRRTLAIEARLANPDAALRPGMLANVEIGAEREANALFVPPVAVQVRGPTHYVFRVANGCAERVDVEIGAREPDRIEIRRGLAAGERVVVQGLQDLTGGEAVRVVGARADQRAEPRCGRGDGARTRNG